MRNISHSLSKSSSSGNGFAGKTIYDDVFGGPPKFGVPTLSPRFEEYNEIFEGFHASRDSSIPILDLPLLDDLSFDVRTSMFDYSQVFGDFNSLDFALSYHELFNQSNGGDDSSDEAWTPAQSDSLSDESDPSACSEENKILSNGVHHQSINRTTQFNVSYHKANPNCKEDMSNVMAHVTHLQAVPGFTLTVNEIPPLQKIEDENSNLQVTNNLNLSMDFGGAVTEGKQFRKTMSQPPNSNSGSLQNESFVSVSNISLRTQPSQLPPPSRPPPALAVKRGDSDRLNSKLKASKSYAFERIIGESSPPYFDVEICASSSAAASAAAMKNAVEKAQVKLSSAKGLMERKEGLQSRSKLQLEGEIKSKEGKMSEDIDRSIGFKDERVRGTCEREGARIKPYDAEERQKVFKKTHVFSGSIEGEKHINVTGEFAERMHLKEHRSSQGSHKTEGTVEWREATQFYEVVEKERAKDEKFLLQNSKSRECGEERKVGVEVFEQQEYGRKIKTSREAFEWEENGHQLKVDKGVCEWDDNKERKVATKESHMQEEHQVKANVAQRVCEGKENENEKKLRVAQLHGDIQKTINEADKCEECENLIEDQLKKNEVEAIVKLKGANEKIENEKRLEDAHERKENVRILKETSEREDYERIPKEAVDRAENEKRVEETLEQEAREKQQKEAHESKENDKKQKEACERGDNEKKQKEACEKGENERSLEEAPKQEGYEMRSKEAFEQKESENGLRMGLDLEENKKEQKLACEREQKVKRLTEARTQDENEKNLKEPLEPEENGKKPKRANAGEENGKRLNDVCEREKNENRLKESWEHEDNNIILQEVHEREQSEKSAHEAFEKEGMKKGSKEASEWEETENRVKDAGNWEGLRGQNKDHEQTVREENERKLNLNQELYVRVEGQNFKVPDGACKLDDDRTPQAPRVADKYDINSRKLEATQETLSCEEDRKFRTEPKDCERETEVVEWVNVLVEESVNSSGMDQNDLLHETAKIRMGDATKSRQLHDSVAKSNGCGVGIGQTYFENYKGASEMSSDTKSAYMLLHKQGERGKNIKGVRFTFDQEGSKREFTPSPVVREWVEDGRKTGDARLAVLEVKGNLQNTAQKITSQSVKGGEKSLNEILSPEEREKEERLKRARELENDHLRKIEEEREREREREKDRMAVDRATREACERAFVESRERAARAAVERATAEVRQRALTEVRERLEKASAEARERLFADRASMEARLRAERAAVERATAEARERAAVEKSKAEKSAFDAQEQVERSVADTFSASSRSGGMVQSSSSFDVQFQREGSSRGLRYLESSVHGGVEGESAQRCKARLERHQRTAERAAKALAEKNMRDLLTQREQTERNRLAEVLDAEVKRWSSGKEGNLRALLSTLQYILGPDSGWQSIPLTDVITSVSVKKAYRKATLCVHPDKLQQRGANIQQKYICEKVFDLLKEAWNKFNSEER